MSFRQNRTQRPWRRLSLERLEQRLVLDASMLRITEFMASNDNALLDAEGDSSDWLEIYNSGGDQVDLSGMYLTDRDDNLTKWAFPAATSLEAGEFLVVFASNKDTILAGGEIHTNFKLSSGGEFLALVNTNGVTILDQFAPEFPSQFEDISYGRAMEITGAATTLVDTGAQAKALVPTNESLGSTWLQPGFNDNSWPIAGPTGLGYENSPGNPINYTDEIQTMVPSGTTSLYVRLPFNLASSGDIGRLTLRMRYDDGFVAYLNGQKVAESNAPDSPTWDSLATALHDDGLSEQFEEFDISFGISALQAGSNVLAIHSLNLHSGSSDMLISPELIAESASIVSPEQIGFFSLATPGYANGDSIAGFVADPTFSVAHGYYETTQNVAIASATPGALIVYTTDASTPTVDGNLNITNGVAYTSPLNISGTTTLRAAAFKTDFQPSFVSASTYLFVDDIINQSPLGQTPFGWPSSGVNGQVLSYGIDPEIISLYGSQAVKDSLTSLSTFSITTDLDNLFDPTTGIYVNARNRGKSWERAANVELFFPDGSEGFEVNAGLRIRGGFSRGGFNPKHAFRFYFRSEYGDSKLRYDLFDGEGADKFDVLDLRTAQNYSWSLEGNAQHTFVREIFGRDTQRDLGSPYTRSRYHHLYVNGVYWGVFQTQERVEEFYSEWYFGGDKDDYDVVKAGLADVGGTEISEGNDIAWRALFDSAQAIADNPVANADNYWTMQGLNPDGTRNPALPVLLDADNLIDYMMVIFYTGGFDSGLSRFLGDNKANNWFGLRNRESADEGFRFFIHDNEHSLGSNGTQNIDRTGPFNKGNEDVFAQFNPQYLHQDLLANEEYRVRFADHVQKHFFNDGALTPAASIARLLDRKNEVDPAIIAESARWGDSKRTTPRNKTDWQNEINWLTNTYFPGRSDTVLGQLQGDGLVASITAPAFNQQGGPISSDFDLTITAESGSIYYTTDGVTDPRLIGGAVNPAATLYTGSFPLAGTTTVQARRQLSPGVWSAMIEATFVGPQADFDADGDVDGTDFLVWQRGFGITSGATLTEGDADSNGTVDAADLVAWQSQFVSAFVEPQADFDADGDIDGSDFLAWQRGFGITSGATLTEGDADGNGAVDAADFEEWQSQFGAVLEPVIAAATSSSTPASFAAQAQALLLDGAAFRLRESTDFNGFLRPVATRSAVEVDRVFSEPIVPLIFQQASLEGESLLRKTADESTADESSDREVTDEFFAMLEEAALVTNF
ncbi:MAG: hypothetical protein GXP24_06020 [Planctomycetes bacterium]|nr:hypothetical protein [Planctomycetota bacterium]